MPTNQVEGMIELEKEDTLFGNLQVIDSGTCPQWMLKPSVKDCWDSPCLKVSPYKLLTTKGKKYRYKGGLGLNL